MPKTKEEIEVFLKLANPNNLAIFKTKKDNDYSLTPHGYLLITTSKLYSKTFIAYSEKEVLQSINALVSLKKIFENSPYFIKGRRVYYFDEVINAEISIHGTLTDYLTHLKNVDKFNSKK